MTIFLCVLLHYSLSLIYLLIPILARGILVGRLQEICVKENVCCDGEALEALIEGMHLKKKFRYLMLISNLLSFC